MKNNFPLFECEACDKPIFEGEPYHQGEHSLCFDCAPTYEDFLDNPEDFADEDGNEYTFAKAREIVSAHPLAGGNLSDRMVEDAE